MKTDIILLAAGNSRRFQGNKLLYPLHGKPIIQYTLDTLSRVLCHRVIVVTQYEEVMTMAKPYGYTLIHNPHPEWGISHSIRLGLQETDSDQVLFLVGDQPYLRAKTLQGMLDKADGSMILTANNQNPVIFPQRYFDELKQLEGDTGGRVLFTRYPDNVVCYETDPNELKDIDTRKDL